MPSANTRPTDAFFDHVCLTCDEEGNTNGFDIDGIYVDATPRAMAALRAAFQFLDEERAKREPERACVVCSVNPVLPEDGEDTCEWCLKDA